MHFLLILNLIIPFVLILVGFLLKKHPVSDMSRHNGYDTPISRKSQAHWDYAQSIAPDNFMSIGKKLAIVEIILSILMYLCHISVYVALIVGNCVGFAFMFYGFLKTDSQIEKNFETQ